MKFPRLLFLLTVAAAPALAQSGRPELVSDRPGHAEVKVLGVVIHADEATLNRETKELAMRGHVHALLPAREDHTVVRYGDGVLLTDQAIGLTADRLTVKNGALQAWGNIVVAPADPELRKVQFRSEEISMWLKTGDATLRGNIRPSGIATPTNYIQAPFARAPYFPPDIIK